MSSVAAVRPKLPEALAAWKNLLTERGFAPELLWIFEENLCFERKPDVPGGIHIGFQTRFAPVPGEALEIAYEHFCESDARLVFYRLGESQGRSVCILLGDPWFADKQAAEGYLRRDDWGISFFPGQKIEIEQINDMRRWIRRLRRERPLHDVDFCMTLASLDEIQIHGRVLSAGERYSEEMLGKLRRIFSYSQ
ncbi:MAG TPA: hypothetical protein PKN95_05770 [Verrucomicrobiota bacterium]|nr:hypothetical protein [Verrucomicrobiota bacterium]HNT15406.1 hypothetical protein [Verrucomicrobiota bacterium]